MTSDHNHKTFSAPGVCVVVCCFSIEKNKNELDQSSTRRLTRRVTMTEKQVGTPSLRIKLASLPLLAFDRNIRWRRHHRKPGRSIAMCTLPIMRKWQRSSIAHRVDGGEVVTVIHWQSTAGRRRCRRMHVFFYYQHYVHYRQSTVFRTNTSITDMNY